MIERKDIFINGEWVPSAASDVLTVINPVTEEPIATVPRGTAEDVERAVQAAARAFPELVADRRYSSAPRSSESSRG